MRKGLSLEEFLAKCDEKKIQFKYLIDSYGTICEGDYVHYRIGWDLEEGRIAEVKKDSIMLDVSKPCKSDIRELELNMFRVIMVKQKSNLELSVKELVEIEEKHPIKTIPYFKVEGDCQMYRERVRALVSVSGVKMAGTITGVDVENKKFTIVCATETIVKDCDGNEYHVKNKGEVQIDSKDLDWIDAWYL